ncbi:MAG: TVP38/TMEM64 family protein [Pseudomonadota bacterium]
MSDQTMSNEKPGAASGITLRKLLPLLIAVVGAVALYTFGSDYLSFEALKENREALLAWRDANYAVAALTFMAIYALATAFSFPGGLALTLTGGFLFGTWFGGTFAVTGATIGAIAIFLAAKTGLGDALRSRAGGWVKKAEAGFRENEISFLLIMRLVPAIPFFAANIVPAFLGASTINYAWTTFVGIIPGALVYASVGAGLGAVFAAGEDPNFGLIFEPQVLGPLLGLAALSALPIVIKKFRGK